MQDPSGEVHVPVQAPVDEESYRQIRQAVLQLVEFCIDHYCPARPDRTEAMRKVREAVMTANASIATGNVSYR